MTRGHAVSGVTTRTSGETQVAMTHDEIDGRRGHYRCHHHGGYGCGVRRAARRLRNAIRQRTRLTRDTEQGILAGVCAGIARRVGLRPKVVRIVAVISLIAFTVPTVLAYGLIAWLAPREDDVEAPVTDEPVVRGGAGPVRGGSVEGLARLKMRFRHLEERFADLEAQMLNDRPA